MNAKRPRIAAVVIIMLATAASAQLTDPDAAPPAPPARSDLSVPLPPSSPALAGPARQTLAGAPAGQMGTPVMLAPALPPITGGDYLGSQRPLTAEERVGLTIASRWRRRSAEALAVKPVEGEQGSVVFAFGASEPNIVCAVLQVCDVSMEPGEHVSSINIGDSARWLVSPAVSGAAPNETQHLIIKPLDVGLSTSLIVTTDKRTYHLALTSRRTDYMPVVAFTYPLDVAVAWEALRQQTAEEAAARQAQIAHDTAMAAPSASGQVQYLTDLKFNYAVTGKAKWKPVRVYNDGTRTIIEMPTTLAQADAPSLIVVRKGGKPSKDDDTSMVNYRLQDGRYIVDEVFDEAVLISGVGHHQERVTIVRGA